MSAAASPRHSSSVDLITMLLVLAGDHQASAQANAKALLRLAEPIPRPEALYHGRQSIVQPVEALA